MPHNDLPFTTECNVFTTVCKEHDGHILPASRCSLFIREYRCQWTLLPARFPQVCRIRAKLSLCRDNHPLPTLARSSTLATRSSGEQDQKTGIRVAAEERPVEMRARRKPEASSLWHSDQRQRIASA